jgi:hypothetical protein
MAAAFSRLFNCLIILIGFMAFYAIFLSFHLAATLLGPAFFSFCTWA